MAFVSRCNTSTCEVWEGRLGVLVMYLRTTRVVYCLGGRLGVLVMYLRTTRVVYCLGGKVGSACDVFEDNEGGILSGREGWECL